MNASQQRDSVFSAPEERCRRLTNIVLDYVAPENPLTVLDIGCGTGAQLFSLAAELPLSSFIGVDFSAANIRIAESTREVSPHGDRITFHACDYMEFQPKHRVDVILSYSTLHHIPIDDDRLFGKIADELSPGGVLINTMPIQCRYNSALTRLRRLLRTVRSRVTDRLILSAARLVHGVSVPTEALRERVLYMYEIPYRFDGAKLHDLLSEPYGLDSVARISEVHASLTQMKHGVHIFRKRMTVD
jgi:trans-aconitate methyltransferase